MGEAQEVQLHINTVQEDEAKAPNVSQSAGLINGTTVPQTRNYKWWILVATYSLFVLCGQSAATILLRLYFVKGGNSKWMATLIIFCAFPILIPFYFISTRKNPSANDHTRIKPPSAPKRALVYIPIGLLTAVVGFLFAMGQHYLPVSTFVLISASQLAFNSLFSFVFNLLVFTPYVINSLVLLTLSVVLLVFNNKSSKPAGESKADYAIGFICTLVGSVGYGLMLTMAQLCYKKVIKSQTFKAVVEMAIFQQLVATSVILLGLFASGDWNGLTREMNEYQLGKASYIMTLVGTAICFQVFTIGNLGLVFQVSSLFSNSVSILVLPIVPILAVFIFHEKMTGIKAISMVLAIWGFISFVYQHYQADPNGKAESNNADPVSMVPMSERLLTVKLGNSPD